MNPSRSPSACSGPIMKRPMAVTGSRRSTAALSGTRACAAPLTVPGVDVKPGEFLLAVDGKEIKTDSEVYRHFEGTVGKRRRAQGRSQSRRLGLAHSRRRADRR